MDGVLLYRSVPYPTIDSPVLSCSRMSALYRRHGLALPARVVWARVPRENPSPNDHLPLRVRLSPVYLRTSAARLPYPRATDTTDSVHQKMVSSETVHVPEQESQTRLVIDRLNIMYMYSIAHMRALYGHRAGTIQ